ncbi:MAG: aspartate carbamoyltransferase regulatory subunit [Bacteroidetes bacterium HGW-Bacteroidetes-6]|jgi:aspartate carbamoyltransferase regulatory subunit|nr:MAG: aspartate carbamoyltransferase regulatory subunit [Bacteroidetes bacterium HGW-Bacteroidetes-6]
MENNDKRQLQVSALENGTVIDHIPQGVVQRVLRILGLEECEEHIYMGANLESKKMGRKGIIKVANTFFETNDINKIGLIAPTATIIEIRDYEIKNKMQVQIPDEIFGMVKCFNPKCITNKEAVSTRFYVIDKSDLKLRCHYCEKITGQKNIEYK